MTGTLEWVYNHGEIIPDNVTAVTVPSSVEEFQEGAFTKCDSLVSIAFDSPTSIKTISNHAFYECRNLTTVQLSEGLETVGKFAFYGCESLTTVEIPTSLTTISENAFRKCTKLKSIKLSEGLEIIGEYAFGECESMTAVEVPNSVKTISEDVFSKCTKLIIVKLSEGLETIGEAAFYGCESLTDVEVPASVKVISKDAFRFCKTMVTIKLSEGLETIGDDAFSDCESLTVVKIPPSVKKISENAFFGCANLTSIQLCEGLETIGGEAFRECKSLTVMEVPASVKTISYNAFLKCTKLTAVKLSEGLKTIGGEAFRECESLTIVEVPASVEIISESAFRLCTMLTTVKLSEGLVTIGDGAFRMCKSLVSLQIPASVKTISENTFLKCTNLTTINLSEGLETIGDGAFCKCESLAIVEVPASVKTISESAFHLCAKLTTVKLSEGRETIGDVDFRMFKSLAIVEIPASVKTISESSFSKCTKLTTVRLSEGLETIRGLAFNHCESLTAVEIPSTVKTIFRNAFSRCTKLKTVKFSEGLETICGKEFSECESLIAVDLPTTVKTILGNAFYKCIKLTTVKLSEGLETIGNGAFSECESLTTVEIPASVKAISENAFYKCRKLTTVKLTEGLEIIGSGAFSNCERLTTVQVPASVQTIGKGAFRKCTKLTTVDLSEGLGMIGDGAFYMCKSLTGVEVPATAKKISNNAFHNCTELTTVKLSEGLETIGDFAFNECTSLTVVEIPASVNTISDDAFSEWRMPAENANTNILSSLKKDCRFTSFPIHALIYRQNSESTAELLEVLNKEYEKNHSTIRKHDMFDLTPLHILCNMPREIDIEILEWCVKKYERAIGEPDNLLRRPIHSAILAGCANLEVIKCLSGNESLVVDKSGNTPLAYGIHRGLPMQCLIYMYAGEPLPTKSMTGKGEVEKLLEVKAEYIKDIIDKCKPPSALFKDFPPYMQHGWVTFVASDESDTSNQLVEFLADDSKCSQNTINLLAYAKNKDGTTAADLAKPEIKKIFEKRILFLGRYDLVKGPAIRISETCAVFEAADKKMNELYEEMFKKYAMEYSGNVDGSLDKASFLKALQDMMVIKVDDEEGFEECFRKIDTNKSRNVSRQAFISFCINELGNRVALKCMIKKDQFERELMNGRKDLHPNCVAEVFRHHCNDEKFDETDLSKGFQKESAEAYKYILAMPYGDKNLDTIFRSEKPDFLDIRKIMKQIGEALQHLHQNDIIHGNLKMSNVIRIKDRLVLIDFDASAKIEEPIGANFSSGILPPEMICCLGGREELAKYRAYFGEQRIIEKHKIRIKKDQTKGFVVKSFIAETDVKEKRHSASTKILPYELIKASPVVDIWAFGAILFCLCTGRPLFPVKSDGDIEEGDVMEELYNWNDQKRDEKLATFTDAAAKNLLEKILQTNPDDRPESMSTILKDDFFQNRTVDAHCIEESINEAHQHLLEKMDEMITKQDELNTKQGRQNQKQNILKEGHLMKKHKSSNGEAMRYFILKGDGYFIYCDKEENKHSNRHQRIVCNVFDIECIDPGEDSNFEIIFKGDNDKYKPRLFSAANKDERDTWICELEKVKSMEK